jgi:hypothetical protein
MALVEKVLEEAQVMLERRVVAVEELTAALAPSEELTPAGVVAAGAAGCRTTGGWWRQSRRRLQVATG